MTADRFYSSPEWLALRALALDRDGSRCTVARLLGGPCSGVLHVNHIRPRRDYPDLALDLDNVGSVCASHHPQWEALVRALLNRQARKRCPHVHPYPQGRAECEARLNGDLVAA